MCPKPVSEERHRQPLVKNCLAVVLRRKDGPAEGATDGSGAGQGDEENPPAASCDGVSIFRDFVEQNGQCFWNSCLVQCVSSLEYKGCLVPTTILVASSDFSLEVIRSAWSRRVLRPPRGYDIRRLGEVALLEMAIIPQTQFAPLTEALCKVVCELNAEGILATNDVISSRLEDSFPEMVVPGEEILYRTLGGLIRERKLYHTGQGYFVVTPDTYRLTATSPPSERQILMTNEEAIVRLHGNDITGSPLMRNRLRSLAIQTNENDISNAWKCADNVLVASSVETHPAADPRLERGQSLRLLRGKGHQDGKDKLNRCNSLREPAAGKNGDVIVLDGDTQEPQKREKVSMLSKFFRRVHFLTDRPTSAKHVTFSAQFPPVEWSDPSFIHFHSVGTQTLDKTTAAISRVKQRNHCRAHSRERRSLHVHPLHSEALLGDIRPDNLLNLVPDCSPRRTIHADINRRRSIPASKRLSQKITSPTRHQPHSLTTGRRRHHRSSSESPTAGSRLNNKELAIQQRQALEDKYKRLNTTQNGLPVTSGPPSNPKAVISPCPVSIKAPPVGPFQTNAKSTPTHSPSHQMSHPVNGSPVKTTILNEQKGTSRVPSVSYNGITRKGKVVRPLTPEKLSCSQDANKQTSHDRKATPTKDVIIDNSVNLEISVNSKQQQPPKDKTPPTDKKANMKLVGTTVNQTVTRETSVNKDTGFSKVTTVTSVSTSLSHNALKDLDKKTSPAGVEPRSKSTTNSPLHEPKKLDNCNKNLIAE